MSHEVKVRVEFSFKRFFLGGGVGGLSGESSSIHVAKNTVDIVEHILNAFGCLLITFLVP